MLLLANLPNTKWCKNPEKLPKPWQMGTHLRVLSESFPMNTNMTGFRGFSKIFVFLCLGWKLSLSIGRVREAIWLHRPVQDSSMRKISYNVHLGFLITEKNSSLVTSGLISHVLNSKKSIEYLSGCCCISLGFVCWITVTYRIFMQIYILIRFGL